MSLLSPRIVAVVAAAGVSLSACQGDQDDPSASSPPDTQTSGAEQNSPMRFAKLFDGYSADYEPYEDTQEMEAASQLVLGGTITDVRPGRILYAESLDSPEAAQALVMEVAWSEVISGDAPQEDSVYVELPSGARSASEFDQALPEDASVGLYLVPAMDETDDFAVGDEDAGRPEGAPLWVPVGPQGFAMATENADTVMPLDVGAPMKGMGDVVPGE